MLQIDQLLDPPRYGFTRGNRFYRPSKKEIFSEFFFRLNLFRSRKNWLSLWSWVASLSFSIPLVLFLAFHFSWSLAFIGFVYSMVILGTHGTIWLHRYSTHRAFTFRNRSFRTLCRNLVIKIIPEETYVISHHVHHGISEKAGDPYNVHGGWLYCFLADVNHQMIAQNLSEKQYRYLCGLMEHTGVKLNTYSNYLKWGSICHPAYTIAHYLLNWSFWYGFFFLIGGHSLSLAIFGASGVWAIGIRTFNYDGHGRGKDLRKDGIDFNRMDLSINRVWPGYVAGEWHNNHHLYPNSARCGFLTYQLDLAWIFIRTCAALGVISSFKDNRQDFMTSHYLPYLRQRAVTSEGPATSP